MAPHTSTLMAKRFQAPDEIKPMGEKGRMEIVKMSNGAVGRATLQPGWRWSEQVGRPLGKQSCEEWHLRYVISGRQRLMMDDGTELEIGPGDVVAIPPGHDGWVVGDEPCVLLDLHGVR